MTRKKFSGTALTASSWLPVQGDHARTLGLVDLTITRTRIPAAVLFTPEQASSSVQNIAFAPATVDVSARRALPHRLSTH